MIIDLYDLDCFFIIKMNEEFNGEWWSEGEMRFLL